MNYINTFLRILFVVFLQFLILDNCYATNNKNIDTIIQNLQNENSLLRQKISIIEVQQDSLLKVTESNRSEIHFRTRETNIYTALLTMQTGIFALIVAIVISFVGYFIPKSNERKYRKLLDEIRFEIKNDRYEMNAAINFLDMTRLLNLKSYSTFLSAAYSSMWNLINIDSYKSSNRIQMILAYVIKSKKLYAIDDLKSSIDFVKFDFDELISALRSGQYYEVYKSEFEEFLGIVKGSK